MGTELIEGLLYFWGFLMNALISSALTLSLAVIIVNLPYLSVIFIPLFKQAFSKSFKGKEALRAELPTEILSLLKEFGDYTVLITPAQSIMAYVKDYNKKLFYISSAAIEQLSIPELKYFVAHEIGHVELEHISRRIQTFKYFIYATTFIYLLIQPHWFIAALSALPFVFYLFHIFRADEDQADLFAVNKLGLATVSKTITRLSARTKSGPKFTSKFMYHRSADEKIAYLSKQILIK